MILRKHITSRQFFLSAATQRKNVQQFAGLKSKENLEKTEMGFTAKLVVFLPGPSTKETLGNRRL